MPKYQLMAPFWDGATMHKRLDVLEFAEGAAPKGSVLLQDPAQAVSEASEEEKAIAAAKAAAGPKPAARVANPQAKEV